MYSLNLSFLIPSLLPCLFYLFSPCYSHVDCTIFFLKIYAIISEQIILLTIFKRVEQTFPYRYLHWIFLVKRICFFFSEKNMLQTVCVVAPQSLQKITYFLNNPEWFSEKQPHWPSDKDVMSSLHEKNWFISILY